MNQTGMEPFLHLFYSCSDPCTLGAQFSEVIGYSIAVYLSTLELLCTSPIIGLPLFFWKQKKRPKSLMPSRICASHQHVLAINNLLVM